MATSTSTPTGPTSTARSASSSSSAKPSGSPASKQASSSRAKPQGTAAYVRETGQRVVDVPVGAVLSAGERVSGAVQPWTSPQARRRELSDLRKQIVRYERRGGEARRQATDRVREAGETVAERVGTTLGQGRSQVEDRLERVRGTLTRRDRSS